MGNIYHTVKCLLFQFKKKCCQLCSFLIHNTLCIPSNDLFSHSCLPHQSLQVTYQAPNQHRLSLTNNSISYFQLVVYFLFLLLLPLYMFFNSTIKKNEIYGQFFIKKINKTLRIVILTKKNTCMEFIAQNISKFTHKDKKKRNTACDILKKTMTSLMFENIKTCNFILCKVYHFVFK